MRKKECSRFSNAATEIFKVGKIYGKFISKISTTILFRLVVFLFRLPL